MTTAMLFRIILSAFLLAPVTSASAQRPIEQSVQRLTQVGTFAFGGVGIAGVTSQGEKDFRVIMSQPPDRALVLFEEIYKTGNLQAKSYALAGIRALNPSRFRAIYTSALTEHGDVNTMSGCIGMSEHFTDIAHRIDEGMYDLWLKKKLGTSTRT